MGTIRAGLVGGFIAWLGFTLPSAMALTLFAFVLQGFNFGGASWIHGLKIVAVAIVAQAVLSMWQRLIKDKSHATIAIASMVILLLWQTAFSQVIIIIASGLIGLLLYRETKDSESTNIQIPVSRMVAGMLLAVYFFLLVLLPLLRQMTGNQWIAIADSFYRSGSLVFGGGHVVLPLLEQEVVPVGWISKENFLAGYGAAQAVPGPLFTLSSYLGAMIHGIWGAVLSTFAIFLPAFLLIIGALPFWNTLRANSKIQGALIGTNAAVVGLLLSALYNPLWTSAIFSSADLALAVVLFGMLVIWSLPPWIIVIAGATLGTFLRGIGI